MYRVLVPVDDDEDRALAQVETLLSLPANEEDLAVTVLHVYEGIDAPPDEAGATLIDDLNESLPEIQGVPDSVSLVEERLRETRATVERRDMVGSPADGIGQIADEIDADVILLGVRKRSPVGKAVFGSVSQTVILNANRPVLIAD